VIPLMTAQIVDRLPANGDHQDEAERTPVGVGVADPDVRNELRQRHQQEVQIEEEAKLLEQHQRQEGDEVVLLVSDLIRRKLFRIDPAQIYGAGPQFSWPEPFAPAAVKTDKDQYHAALGKSVSQEHPSGRSPQSYT